MELNSKMILLLYLFIQLLISTSFGNTIDIVNTDILSSDKQFISPDLKLPDNKQIKNVISGKSNALTSVVDTRSFGSRFKDLPTSAQLNNFISSANVLEISKTIQRVVSNNNLNCNQKISYLSDFLGRINTFIGIRQYRVIDLEKIIQVLRNQIKNLQGQIKSSQDQIAALNIVNLKVQLSQLMIKLQDAYEQFNKINIDDTPLKNKITQLRNQIKKLQQQINQARKQLLSDRSELQKTNSFIIDLENKISMAKIQREILTKRLLNYQAIISTSTSRISSAQTQILKIETQIKELTQKKKQLKNIYINLEKQVKTLDNLIKANEKKQTAIIKDTNQDKIKLTRKQNQLLTNQNQLIRVNSNVTALKKALPNVQTEIQTLRLKCNGVVNPICEILQGQTILKFNQAQFKRYFNSVFGANLFNTFFVNPVLYQNLNSYVYNYFAPQWTQNYGRVFQNQLKSANGNGNGNTFTFSNDFQCSSLNFNSLTSSVCNINKIEGNTIVATDDSGKIFELQLGACSNIIGPNKFIPKVGSRIAWRGSSNIGSRFNVNDAFCL